MRKYAFVFVIIFISCSNEENFDSLVVDGFPPAVELKGINILKNEQGLVHLSLTDSLVICVSERDTIFHIYDKEQQHLASFGQKGRGPGEFVIPPIIQDIVVEDQFIKALVIDDIKKEIVSINLSESIEKEEVVVRNSFKIPRELMGITNIFYVDNKKFVGVYDDRFDKMIDHRRGGVYYSLESDSFEIFNLHNLELTPYQTLPEMNLNARIPGISPNRSKLAIVLVHSPKLEVFDLGSTVPNRYQLDPKYSQENFYLEDFNDGEIIEYYRHLYVTNNYLYLLFNGYTSNVSSGDQRILVMDWNGHPQSQYLIPDEYNLTMFVVDEKNKTIYGLSYENDSIYLFGFE